MEPVSSGIGLVTSKLEKILVSEAPEVDVEYLFQHVFSIQLILKKILQNMTTPDLLQSSLVSKQWCYFCRELLRERYCPVIINETEACSKLVEFVDVLKTSDDFPFNSLAITIPTQAPFRHEHEIITSNNTCDMIHNLKPGDVENFELKSLSLQLCSVSYNCGICLKRIRLILAEKASSLECLSFDINSKSEDPSLLEDLNIINFNKGPSLPKLRRLSFPYRAPKNFSCPESLMAKFIQAAPNVHELFGKFECTMLPSILESKLTHAMKEFYFVASRPFLDMSMKLAQLAPKFQILLISTASLGTIAHTRITEWNIYQTTQLDAILSLILTSSAHSLERFAIHQFDLIRLSTLGILTVLKNVRYCKALFVPEIDQSEGYFTLNKIDWEKYFPNLKIVGFQICASIPEQHEYFLSDSFRNRREEFTCGSVTKFIWSQNNPGTPDLDLANFFKNLTSLFPNVVEFILDSKHGFLEFFGNISTVWERLECIRLVKLDWRTLQICDSLFCGISVDEYQHLSENVQHMDNLHIVPQQFSLSDLKCFKKLVLKFKQHYCFYDNGAPMEMPLWLSSELCFKRNPNLEVEVYHDKCLPEDKTDCRFSFECLKPVVKIFKEKDYDVGP